MGLQLVMGGVIIVFTQFYIYLKYGQKKERSKVVLEVVRVRYRVGKVEVKDKSKESGGEICFYVFIIYFLLI